MDKKQWSIAHDLAFDLIDWGTDPNELGKVIAFLRQKKDDTAAKSGLLLLVQRLASDRNPIIRSRQTQRFYRNIQEAIEKHLNEIENTSDLLLILGWSLRLMRYYRVEPKRAAEEQLPQKPQPEPEVKTKIIPLPLPEEKVVPKVKERGKVNATVLKKEGVKVTVQLQTDENEELTFETGFYLPNVGDEVKVKVQTVDTDGKIKKVTPA